MPVPASSSMTNFNPGLVHRPLPSAEHTAGKGDIERPGAARNLIWQSRSQAPTDFENALGDALETAFDAGAETPTDVVASLNAQGLHTPDGRPWTEDAFLQAMRGLGA